MFQLFVLCLFIFLTFLISELYYFLFFFEITLIPISIIIVLFSYKSDKFISSLYLININLCFSIPFIISVSMFYIVDFNLVYFYMYSLNSVLIVISFCFLFLIKLPLYFFHY